MLARAYDVAVRGGDSLRAAEIADAYVEHLVDAGRHFRAVARERFGRETGQVLLLHANRLAMDHAGAAIDALVAYEWLTQEQADEAKTFGGNPWMFLSTRSAERFENTSAAHFALYVLDVLDAPDILGVQEVEKLAPTVLPICVAVAAFGLFGLLGLMKRGRH